MNDSLKKFKDRKRHHENKERDKAKDHHRKEKGEQKKENKELDYRWYWEGV